jgi:hypothetical protein
MAGDRLLQRVEPKAQRSLADYEAVAHLAQAVHELRSEAGAILPRLAGRMVWMVNSTAQGGGVAEMLLSMVALLRDLGVRTEWVVIGSREPEFFTLTKRIHNLIHGTGDPRLGKAERELFERVNRENAEELGALVRPGDLLVVGRGGAAKATARLAGWAQRRRTSYVKLSEGLELGDEPGRLFRKHSLRQPARRALDLGAPAREQLEQCPAGGRYLGRGSAPASEAIERETELIDPFAVSGQPLHPPGRQERTQLLHQRPFTPVLAEELIGEVSHRGPTSPKRRLRVGCRLYEAAGFLDPHLVSLVQRRTEGLVSW